MKVWMDKAFSHDGLRVSEIILEHNAIMESVFARDSSEARKLMESHLESASERLLKVVGKDSVLKLNQFVLQTHEVRPEVNGKNE